MFVLCLQQMIPFNLIALFQFNSGVGDHTCFIEIGFAWPQHLFGTAVATTIILFHTQSYCCCR